jgi:hypothetical protein
VLLHVAVPAAAAACWHQRLPMLPAGGRAQTCNRQMHSHGSTLINSQSQISHP